MEAKPSGWVPVLASPLEIIRLGKTRVLWVRTRGPLELGCLLPHKSPPSGCCASDFLSDLFLPLPSASSCSPGSSPRRRAPRMGTTNQPVVSQTQKFTTPGHSLSLLSTRQFNVAKKFRVVESLSHERDMLRAGCPGFIASSLSFHLLFVDLEKFTIATIGSGRAASQTRGCTSGILGLRCLSRREKFFTSTHGERKLADVSATASDALPWRAKLFIHSTSIMANGRTQTAIMQSKDF